MLPETGINPMRENALRAKSIAEHGRTVAVLTDNRPGLDLVAAQSIARALTESGYLVHEVTVREFCEKTLATLGFALLIPHAVSVPAVCAEPLRKYWSQGGQVITLGGPLFADLIEPDGDGFQKVPLDNQILDATFTGRMTPFVMEGFAPTYKIYFSDDARVFRAEAGQPFVRKGFESDRPERVVCPGARPRGLGYGMERRNRYIPLVEIVGEGGRAEGRRGAAAFLMLSDTRCHLPVTNGNRPGSVSATTVGSVAGSIGLTRQDILSVHGVRETLLAMLGAMRRGLFLFEGGADRFVCRSGESARLGARILNAGQDFQEATVRASVTGDGSCEAYEAKALAMPRNMTTVEIPWRAPGAGEYRVEIELLWDGCVIDRVCHELSVTAARLADPSEFVSVRGGEFYLGDKPWCPFGVNYWPHYYPGFEREDYWLGWLDKSNYDPLEVERDIAHMRRMGYTCLFTRLDGNVFERTIPQLKDFMRRLERHGMKLSLSYCNATCPVNYQPAAFRKLMDEADLRGNPVLFGHDIAWEIGTQFFADAYAPQWEDRWADWIAERYGSVENAERDWGMPAPRAEDGHPVAPPRAEFLEDGPWRVRTAAYRRFIDDMVSRMWNDTVSDMRAVDPDHIISYRMGAISHACAALTATNKHIDYASPEGYSVSFDENGFYSSGAITRAFDMLTDGKPVVWSEFGMSLTDVRWRSLIWDNEHWKPYPHKIAEQADYMRQFYRMFRATGVRGAAPWWYPGGFRMVEMSDFGLVGPDGVERPAALEYAALGEWFAKPKDIKAPDDVVTIDPDAHAGGYGHLLIGDNVHNPLHKRDPNAPRKEEVPGEALLAFRKAETEGRTVSFRTPGTGTDSANTPAIAVGNTPYNGQNPPKYLNAEFNAVQIVLEDGSRLPVKPGGAVEVPRGAPLRIDASVGNLREATWLAPAKTKTGGVFLVSAPGSELTVRAAIPEDTPYLRDARIDAAALTGGVSRRTAVALRMEAEGRMAFGEILRFTLAPSEGGTPE